MENRLVSIIVPIYNVKKYLNRCIESLLGQDYHEIEIILVDDGSPDQSGLIADIFAEKESHIHVMHQKNMGVSEACNAGLEKAHGEYIMFVDGDDWVDSNYVSYFLGLVENDGLDLAFNITSYRVDNSYTEISEHIASAEDCIAEIYSGKIDVAVWNKNYKRNVLLENNITFNPEIWYGEGMLFNIEVLQWVENVSIGGRQDYHQTINLESAMRKFDLASNMCGLKSLEIQKSKCRKKTKIIEKQWNYHRYRFYQSILNGIVRSDMTEEYSEQLREAIAGLRQEIMIPLTCESSIVCKINWLCYYIAPMMMAKQAANKYTKYVELGGAKFYQACCLTILQPIC